MSGIGNTIETDLVGELVEVRDLNGGGVILRGRVRAVTTSRDGSLMLWVEILDHSPPYPFDFAKQGDVCTVYVSYDVNSSYGTMIRLIKEAT